MMLKNIQMNESTTEQLIKENHRLNDIIAYIPGHVYWLDLNNVFLGCNNLQAKSFGLSSPNEIVGKTPYDFSSKEIADIIVNNNNTVMQNRKKMIFEELGDDNRIFYSEKVPLFDLNNNVIGILGISTDITERKKTEENINKSLLKIAEEVTGETLDDTASAKEYVQILRDYYQNIIAKIPENVYWLNRDHVFLGCNKNVLDRLGLKTVNEYIGKTYHDFYEPKEAKAYWETDEEVMSTGLAKYLEEKSFDDKILGTKIYLTHKTPLLDENNNVIGMLGISVDITERKKMEKELQEAKEKAEIASEAKSEFIKNMSHDIRTPLNGIMGMAQLLEIKETDPEKHEYIDALLASSKRLASLLTEILELVRLDSGERPIAHEKINIKTIAEDVVALMLPEAQHKSLKIKLEYSDKIPESLISDGLRVHRILLNLVSNALKFTQTGYIKIIVIPKEQNHHNITVEFIVQDTGIGIPKDKFDVIFERFTKLNSSYTGAYKGSGLGLYIVKEMVKELGGQIKVTSEPGHGSAFIYTIPLEIPEEAKKSVETNQEFQKITPNDIEVNETKKKILLIEDSEICQLAVKELLKELHYHADAVGSAKAALELIKKNQYDLLLLDIGLPDMDGITLTNKIRKELNINIPIIATTAHAWDRSKYEEVKINDQIRKPITLQGLKHTLKQYL